jgi:hypothetical protein
MRGTRIAYPCGMEIRVASLSELPPGRGKVIEIEGRQITIYNLEGRLVATATRAPHSHVAETTDCSAPGLHFDAFAEDSPARLSTDEECRVWLDGEDIWMAC